MIFPESFYGAKDEDISNDLTNEPEKPKYKLNILGLVFNLVFSLLWLWLAHHFMTRLSANDFDFFYGNVKQGTDKLIIACNTILSIYHMLYCVVPSFGVGEHDGLQTSIPLVTVLAQIVVIFNQNLLKDEHYSNYLWAAPVIMGSISVGILTSNDSDGKDTLLLYFKPWVIKKYQEDDVQRAQGAVVVEDQDVDAVQNNVTQF